ncbi:hypothetical protein [Arthrobacter sp. UYEF3]|uniref:hypothetical protein n=1 Tax=Arthrobacter sp. UYEF3 TaxID=1756365 RepID=UPI0033990185
MLCAHRNPPDGGRSNTAVFSIPAEEWPRARDGLENRLAPFAIPDSYAVHTFAAR